MLPSWVRSPLPTLYLTQSSKDRVRTESDVGESVSELEEQVTTQASTQQAQLAPAPEMDEAVRKSKAKEVRMKKSQWEAMSKPSPQQVIEVTKVTIQKS